MYIKIYEKACPICFGNVKGNFRYKYHCESCSLLFDYKDLNKPPILVEILTDNIIIKERIKNKTSTKLKKKKTIRKSKSSKLKNTKL